MFCNEINSLDMKMSQRGRNIPSNIVISMTIRSVKCSGGSRISPGWGRPGYGEGDANIRFC